MQILFLVKDNFVAAGEFTYHLVLKLGITNVYNTAQMGNI